MERHCKLCKLKFTSNELLFEHIVDHNFDTDSHPEKHREPTAVNGFEHEPPQNLSDMSDDMLELDDVAEHLARRNNLDDLDRPHDDYIDHDDVASIAGTSDSGSVISIPTSLPPEFYPDYNREDNDRRPTGPDPQLLNRYLTACDEVFDENAADRMSAVDEGDRNDLVCRSDDTRMNQEGDQGETMLMDDTRSVIDSDDMSGSWYSI